MFSKGVDDLTLRPLRCRQCGGQMRLQALICRGHHGLQTGNALGSGLELRQKALKARLVLTGLLDIGVGQGCRRESDTARR